MKDVTKCITIKTKSIVINNTIKFVIKLICIYNNVFKFLQDINISFYIIIFLLHVYIKTRNRTMRNNTWK